MTFDYAFIDFDNTVYESHILVDYIKDVFSQYGVSEEDFRSTTEQAVHGTSGQYYDYSFELHIVLLQKKGYPLDQEKVLGQLNKAFETNMQADDAEEFLAYMRTRAKKLILLTAGNGDFQLHKVRSTTLIDYFDDIHVVHGDKQVYVREMHREQDKNIFINDNLKQNTTVHDLFPGMVVLTRRHPRKYTDEDMAATGIPYFNTLTEIKNHIDSTY